MRVKTQKIESHVLDGMSQHIEAQAEAVSELSGEELSAKLREPKADVSAKAGNMERNAPLFFGTGDNPSLFTE